MASLCGVWVDGDGRVRTTVDAPGGDRREQSDSFRPFAWLGGSEPGPQASGISIETLKGLGAFSELAHADSLSAYDSFLRQAENTCAVDVLRPLESQYLLQNRARLYAELAFSDLRRCQLDIETDSPTGRFSDAERDGDRVLAIGLSCGGRTRLLQLAAPEDGAERELLAELNSVLDEWDPDTIEGHNIFRFDLEYLRVRCRRHRVPCAWGRYGQAASFRNSRLKVAERWLDYPRCDLAGRAVIDTFLLVQLYDVVARDMASYGLKAAAVYFGITPPDRSGRTYIDGDKIAAAFRGDRARFSAYLEDDLRETRGLGNVLLPTYFEQSRLFPILLQEAALRGTTAKIDLLLLDKYYHSRQACPLPPEIAPFEGGYTRSFQQGVFRKVLHCDVASLYPSLLLHLGRNPAGDSLGAFIPLLRDLREYRLRYKQIARTAPSEAERSEAQARQATFKILINSFYGYLGFSGARFGDGDLAAEVTRKGRELLQALIEEFARIGCTILEADTDGIYLSSEEYFDQPEALLGRVASILPDGIELECDGRYPAMFCYRAKNYALYDGSRVILRGSAFRSRGIEPYLQRLTDCLVGFLLGATPESPLALLDEYRRRILASEAPVIELARSENLSTNPEAYEQLMAGGGKPRRAAAEAALKMDPRPQMGERVSYYIGPKSKGRATDWQRANPVALFDREKAPYDPQYYADKLDDWLERYAEFLGVPAKRPGSEVQGELGQGW